MKPTETISERQFIHGPDKPERPPLDGIENIMESMIKRKLQRINLEIELNTWKILPNSTVDLWKFDGPIKIIW